MKKLLCILFAVLLLPVTAARADEDARLAAAFLQKGTIYTYSQLPETGTQLDARAVLTKDGVSETLLPFKTENISETTPVAYMVLLDVSGSMKNYRDSVKLFADSFSEKANGDLRFYFGTIGDGLTLSDELSDKDELLNEITNAEFDAMRTNLYASAAEAVRVFDSQPRGEGQFNIIVTITDGKDTSNDSNELIKDALSESAPVMIHSITVSGGEGAPMEEIAGLTCGTSGGLSDDASAGALAETITQSVNRLTFARFEFPADTLDTDGCSLEIRYSDSGVVSPKYTVTSATLPFIADTSAPAAPPNAAETETPAPSPTVEPTPSPSGEPAEEPTGEPSGAPSENESPPVGAAADTDPPDGEDAPGTGVPLWIILASSGAAAVIVVILLAAKLRENPKPAGAGMPLTVENLMTKAVTRHELPYGGVLTVGRSKKCDVVLKDTSVEPENSRLTFSDGAVYIEDLNSTNGTLINGMKIDSANKLRSGAEITIGSARFIVKF
jgi:cell division septation protein DedD